MLLLVGTHSSKIHALSYDTAAETIRLLQSTTLEPQPSWIVPSVHHPGLIYTNSWENGKLFAMQLHSSGKLDVVSSTLSGGSGPTYWVETADGSALVVANYNSGSISRIPLDAKGHFASATSVPPANILRLDFAAPAVPHSRQDAAHPHHIIPFGEEEYWVPDLGGDRVWHVRWRDGQWETVESLVCEGGSGPRHGVLHPDGSHLYIVNELSSTISTFNLTTFPPTLLPSAPSTLPPSISIVSQSSRGGPYETIACAIVLLTSASGHHRLLVSNRDIPRHLSPDGDMLAEFKFEGYMPSTPIFIWGLGGHPRGVHADLDGSRVAVVSRAEGGLTMFQVAEERVEIVKSLEGWGKEVLDRPVSVAWVREEGLAA